MTNHRRIRESDQRRLTELKERHPKLFRCVILPWFMPDGYRKMRAAAADRDNLCDSFNEFEQLATKRLSQVLADGHPVEKVEVDADALIEWCAAEERPLDGMARQTFAILTLVKRDSRGGHA